MNYTNLTTKQYILVSTTAFILGALLFALYNGWIIVRYPSYHSEVAEQLSKKAVVKKDVKLIFWHNNKWHTENTHLIWQYDKARTLDYLINTWLTLLDEDSIMDKKVSLQAALLASSDQEPYLSFDRPPFTKAASTFEKWMWIEGLLKTIRENGIALQRVHFLVHHQPMRDSHLDFSHPWPVTGFLV